MNGIGVVVGDDEDLRRSGEQVDADLAEQLTLGLGDVGVARSGEEVDPLDRLCAEGQRHDGLDPAEQVDLVGARKVHRRDRRRRHLAADRRRAGRDPTDSGHLRRDDRHVRRGGERIAAARHVGARACRSARASGRARRRAASRPRRRSGWPVGPRRIDGRWPARSGCRRAPRRALPRRSRRWLVVVEAERRWRPAVEPFRVLAYGDITTLANVGDDRPHRGGDLLAGGGDLSRRGGGLQLVDHRLSMPGDESNEQCIRMYRLRVNVAGRPPRRRTYHTAGCRLLYSKEGAMVDVLRRRVRHRSP